MLTFLSLLHATSTTSFPLKSKNHSSTPVLLPLRNFLPDESPPTTRPAATCASGHRPTSIGFFLSSITRCTRDKTPFLHSVPPFSRLCHYAASRLPRRIPRKRKLIVAEEEETARLVTVLLQPDRKGRRGPR